MAEVPMMESSNRSVEVFTEVGKAGLQFTDSHVEHSLRSKRSIGLEREDVTAIDFVEDDGFVKVCVSAGTVSNLVKRLFKIENG